MNETDYRFLRAAFAVALRSRRKGNYPFGAVLVGEGGEVLLEAENTVNSDDDCVGHSEVNLVREAARRFDPEALARSTVYASAEPCAMCSGAVFWSGVGRLVYGLSKKRASEIEAGKGAGPQLLLGCRDVLATGQRRVTVEGPTLEDEAAAILKGD